MLRKDASNVSVTKDIGFTAFHVEFDRNLDIMKEMPNLKPAYSFSQALPEIEETPNKPEQPWR